MILKLLTYFILSYFIYILFIEPIVDRINPPEEPDWDNEKEEYVEYEEVE